MEIKCVTSRARQNSFSQPTHITKRQHTLKSAERRTASAAARAAARVAVKRAAARVVVVRVVAEVVVTEAVVSIRPINH